MKTEIRHPEWITLSIDGKPFYGYDQDWYHQDRQILAGCGPTTAAVLASYLERKEKGVATDTKEAALARMEVTWTYVTPRMRGLYKTHWFQEGFETYLKDKNLTGRVDIFTVRPFHILTPSLEKTAAFLTEGLAADCPIAFLNRDNGGEDIFSWHWVPLAAIEENGDDWTCTIWDEGKQIPFSLRNWLKNTSYGGGFVRVTGTDKKA